MDTKTTTAGQSPVYELNGKEGDATRTVTRTDQQGKADIAVYHGDSKTIEFVSGEAAKYRLPVVRCIGEAGGKYARFSIKGDAPDAALPAGAPKRPKIDPRLGDKTPEIVEWYRDYKPKEFKIRYGVLGYASQRIRKIDGAGNPVYNKLTGQPEFDVRKHVLVAHRKTHLTELINGSEVWEDGKGPQMSGEEDEG